MTTKTEPSDRDDSANLTVEALVESVRARLVQAMEDSGMSQAEFIRISGIHHSTVSMWHKKKDERNYRTPTLSQVFTAAAILKVDPAYLLLGIRQEGSKGHRDDLANARLLIDALDRLGLTIPQAGKLLYDHSVEKAGAGLQILARIAAEGSAAIQDDSKAKAKGAR